MRIQTKKLEGTKVQLDIEVEPEVVKKKFDEVYQQLGKEAKIPGFRPGKAPRDILEKHHSRLAQEEVIKNLIPQVYNDSIEKEGLGVVELPEIGNVKLQSNILSFTAVVEVKPKIEVKDYKKIALNYKKVSVSPDEIDKVLAHLKETHKAENIDDRFARGLGYRTLEEMRTFIERQLFVQKENDSRFNLQEDLSRQVVDKVSFKVPESLVERRLEELVRQGKVQMAINGASKEEIAAREENLRKDLEPQALRQAKTFLVFEEIAKKENIPQDEHTQERVMEFLLTEAEWGVGADS